MHPSGESVSTPAWIALAALAGWLWGSFLNTVVDRTPRRGETAAGGLLHPARSRCPGCGQGVRWFDLVPVWSYLRLGGRCASCGAEIGRRTLAVECATPLLFAGYAWALSQVGGYAIWGALLGFGYAALSWLLVAVPLLAEGRQPHPGFVALGVGLVGALMVTALALALLGGSG